MSFRCRLGFALACVLVASIWLNASVLVSMIAAGSLLDDDAAGLMLLDSDESNKEGSVVNVTNTFDDPSTTKSVGNGNKPSLMLLLNSTTANQLKAYTYEKSMRRSSNNSTIDVLIVGSKFRMHAAKVQSNTWGSHDSVRHFVLATEDDDVNPHCHSTMTKEDIAMQSYTCNTKYHWHQIRALNKLTMMLHHNYASQKWLGGKKNAAGWLCAQRRFVSSFTKLVGMYTTVDSLPDYLIIADDDTYFNMEHLEEYLIRQPARLEERGFNQDTSTVPSFNAPVVFAGCKVRLPTHQITFTSPFGGFGTFLSKGSLKRWMQPLHCNETATGYEKGLCNKMLHKSQHKYPVLATVGEERYYAKGDSLNDIFDKYIHKEKYFCMHSDWAFGYFANFLNISRECHPGSDWIAEKFPERGENNRLHDIMKSEIYGSTFNGLCKYGNGNPGKDLGCHTNATICHYVNETEMLRIHAES